MNAPDLSVLNLPSLIVFTALAIMSVLAVTVTFYKTFQFSRLGVGQFGAAETILGTWLGGEADEAVRHAGERRFVLARVLLSLIHI